MRVCLSRKRLSPIVIICFALLLLPQIGPTRGQDKPAPKPDMAAADVLPFGPALLLPSDPGVPKKLQAVRDYAADREWSEAARVVQDLLDMPEDVFLPVTRRGPDGNEIAAGVVSLRSEIDRIFATLPRPGRDAYEALSGKAARQSVIDAKGQPIVLAAVVQRYGHTKAGTEAAVALAAYHLDRGHFDLSAAYFDHVLRSGGDDTPDPLTLFQAALAFRRAGDSDRAEKVWKQLAVAAPDGIRTGNRTVSLADLEKLWLRTPAVESKNTDDAALQGADERLETESEGTAATWMADAVRRLESGSNPVLSPNTPLVVDDVVVSRSLRGIRAVERRTGLPVWESPSALSLDSLARDPATHGRIAPWVEAYLSDHPSVLVENTLLGTLSTDGRRIYAVEDLPLPVRPHNYLGFFNNQGQGLNYADAPELSHAVYHSRLLALDPHSGKVIWSVGGAGLLRASYFLGPPLPLGGKLYVPVQQDFSLRLFCLEPLSGEVLWSQTLATFKSRLVIDGGRRLHAVRLAYGDGLLICPTHAGGLIAFDLVGRRLVWAHVYRDDPAPAPLDPPGFGGRGRFGRRPRPVLVTEPPNLTTEWQVAAPIITGGKVVYAATDAPALFCLDLHDGLPNWQTTRTGGDLFLAGVSDGKVLVVGKAEVRALGLKDGKPLWQCDINTPAGRGALASGAYQLPVRWAEGKTELLTINLGKGVVTSRKELAAKTLPELLPLPIGLAPRSVPDLVAQLGSDCCTERDAATAALNALGAPALAALHQASASDDPEVRRRALSVARVIETRREMAKLLESPTLHLSYKDTPLAEALADFSKKSGVTLKPHGELRKLDERKITLDTGEVPFWEAFDRFCEAAGLVELPPHATAPEARGNSVSISGVAIGGRGATSTDVLRSTPDDKPLELMIGDGKSSTRLASRAGAVRVSLAPPETAVPNHSRQDGEALLALDVAPAGRMQWQKAVGLRIDRAIDDEGRSLMPLLTSFKPPSAANAVRGNIIINGMPVVPPEDEDAAALRLVAVRLKQPAEKPAKRLKELSGTITAQLRTPREPVITIENVLKSAGQIVKGKRGGMVKVLEVAKDEDGQIRLKVQVEAAGRSVADMPFNPFGGTVIINGRRLGEEDLLSSLNFSLVDAKGKPFRTVKAASTGQRAGMAHEYELIYEADAGQGEAAKFVYADRRTVYVDVPFTLKDVPLR